MFYQNLCMNNFCHISGGENFQAGHQTTTNIKSQKLQSSLPAVRQIKTFSAFNKLCEILHDSFAGVSLVPT